MQLFKKYFDKLQEFNK